jgi:hypothetical protein
LFLGVLTRLLDICWTRTLARRTPDARLESRESRGRLTSRGKPHYRLLELGLHIGYRRLKGRKGRPAVAGTWVARHYVGGRSYIVEKIGTADDFSDADGTIILSFAQAQDKARTRMVRRAQLANGIAGPLTVRAAVEGYFEFLEVHGKSGVDARHRAKAHIDPTLGDIEVASLTTAMLAKWLARLAKALPRARTKPGKPQQYRAFDGSEEAIRQPEVISKPHVDDLAGRAQPRLSRRPRRVGRRLAQGQIVQKCRCGTGEIFDSRGSAVAR